MADRHPQQIQVHPTHGGGQGRYDLGTKSLLPHRGGAFSKTPSATQVIALITLLPVGGTLLGLAGLTLAGTLIGLAVTTPVFIIFSPVLVPAVLLFGLAVTGFLSSGAFGLTGLSSLSYVVNYFRKKAGAPETVPEQWDYAKRRVQDATMQVGQKTKDVGQAIQNKAQEGGGGAGK
ncbi:hypothetical protein Leryth_005829 [Lithospermum erythrorhizon]|uniref:Oleosin n=1 Tax=Lithospermum erythrorhizon TaxID=34254 RepID=A0AAV3NQB5_LITER|nr:hypothetical protein Leryth_005829 [Lithospermum erythrorhizon]